MRSPFRAHESTVQILGEPTTSEPLNPEPVNGYDISKLGPILETGNLKLDDTLIASWSIEFRVSSVKFLVVNTIISLRKICDELIQKHYHERHIT